MFLEAFPATNGEGIDNTMIITPVINLSRPKQARKEVHKAREGSILRGMIIAHGDCYSHRIK